ncbi:MAG: BRCT domain-containing protein [Betaproteobacteria bacterium]|nr:BRCT domain-containing protein [Betaproteobacteria bacterium]
MSINQHDPEDPRLMRLHAKRLVERDINQLLGICEFTLQDGHISQDDAESILEWLNNHRACLGTWPANVLFDRLHRMLSDGVLDDDEQGELLGLVMNIARPRTDDGLIVPTALPLTSPAPKVVFKGRSFCFTGVFDFGSRANCQAAVAARGGIPQRGINRNLHYLVIGNIGTKAWKHTSFGEKIAKAVEYRNRGIPLAIIAEPHWVSQLR